MRHECRIAGAQTHTLLRTPLAAATSHAHALSGHTHLDVHAFSCSHIARTRAGQQGRHQLVRANEAGAHTHHLDGP